MTNAELVALLREARESLDKASRSSWDTEVVGDVAGTRNRIDAALAEHDADPPSEDRLTAAHREGMDRMQQAIIDLLNEHNAPPHLIARIVEMEYP